MSVRERLTLDTSDYKRGMKEVRDEAEKTADAQTESFKQGGEEAGKGGAKATVKAWLAGVAGLGLLIIQKVTAGIRGGLGVLRSVVLKIADVTNLAVLGISIGLRALARRFQESEGAARHFGKALEVTATGMEKFVEWSWKIATAITGAKVATAGLVATMAILAARASAQFTPAWNRVLTLLGDATPSAIDKLRAGTSELIGELGVEAPAALETLYNILSAMPHLTAEPLKALDLLRVSLEVGATEFGDASEAASALTTILNAFNLEASEARRISDALFATQDQGVTTFGEIADGIGRVADLTSNLGAEFTDVLGIVAAVTPQGVKTNEVFTQLRAVLSNVLNASAATRAEAKELGIDFSAAGIRAKGLNGFLEDIIETTGGDIDVISKFITSQEGLALMASLSGQLDQLRSKTDRIRESAGSTSDKVEIMNDSWQRQKDILKGELSAALRAVGADFENMAVRGLESVNRIAAAISGLVQNVANADVAFRAVEQEVMETAAAQRRERAAREMADRMSAAQREANRRQNLSLFGFNLQAGAVPGLTVTGIRPPQEPTSVDYSRDKIREMEALRTARAVTEMARTGDLRAYESALKDVDRAVNALVLTEMERLREAGVAEAELAGLAAAYRVVREEIEETYMSAVTGADPIETRFNLFGKNQGKAGLVSGREPLFPSIADPVRFKPDEVAATMAKVTVATQELTRAEGELTQAWLEQDAAGQARATEQITAARDRLRAVVADVAGQMRDLIPDEQKYADIQERLAKILKDAGVTDGEQAGQWEEIASGIEGVGRGLIAAADAAGKLDDRTRRLLQGVVELAVGWRQAEKAIKAAAAAGKWDAASMAMLGGGTIGLIGGAASLLAGLFGGSGESEAAKKVREALEANRKALERNTQALEGRLAGSDPTVGGARSALQAAADALRNAPDDPEGRPTFGPGDFFAMLNAELASKGLSMEDIEALADQFGIELVGVQGYLDLLEKLREISTSDVAANFAGAMELLRREFDLLGVDDPAEKIRRIREELSKFVSEDLANQIAGIDFTDPEAVHAFMESIITAVREGTFDLASLGSLSLEDLLDALNELKDLGGQAAGDTGFSRSVQIARTITEVQAVEFIAWLQDIAFNTRDMFSELQGIHALLAQAFAASSPTEVSVAKMGGGGLSIGDITVQTDLSDDQIRDVFRRLGEEIVLRKKGRAG